MVYVSVYTGSLGVIGVAPSGSFALSGTGAPVSGGVSATGVPGKCALECETVIGIASVPVIGPGSPPV